MATPRVAMRVREQPQAQHWRSQCRPSPSRGLVQFSAARLFLWESDLTENLDLTSSSPPS